MNYDIYLMDADDTLFDFGQAERSALFHMFRRYALTCSDEIWRKYREISQGLWDLFERRQIEREVLFTERFARLFRETGISINEAEFNTQYLLELGKNSDLLPGAKEICRLLCESEKKLFILTNGAAVSQKMRLEGSEIKQYISGLFVSEDIGYQKPQKEYFDYVFDQILLADKSRVMMIGDSLRSDIAGGCRAGIDTCWFNPGKNENETGIKPTYQIADLVEIALL